MTGAILLAMTVQACDREPEEVPLADDPPVEATPAAPDSASTTAATGASSPAEGAAPPTLAPADPPSASQTARPTTDEQIQEYDRALDRRAAQMDAPAEPIEQGD